MVLGYLVEQSLNNEIVPYLDMKQVNITYEDKEYEIILKAKTIHAGNWHDFLLDLSRKYLEEKKHER